MNGDVEAGVVRRPRVAGSQRGGELVQIHLELRRRRHLHAPQPWLRLDTAAGDVHLTAHVGGEARCGQREADVSGRHSRHRGDVGGGIGEGVGRRAREGDATADAGHLERVVLASVGQVLALEAAAQPREVLQPATEASRAPWVFVRSGLHRDEGHCQPPSILLAAVESEKTPSDESSAALPNILPPSG